MISTPLVWVLGSGVLCHHTNLSIHLRTGGREPRRGTLELLAQTARITWPRATQGDCDLNSSFFVREPLHLRPQFIERTSASVLMQALEDGIEGLEVESLLQMARRLDFVILSLAGDLAASNTRTKLAFAEAVRVGDSFGIVGSGGMAVLLLDIVCNAHIIHRIVEKTFMTSKLIPRLHSTAYSAAIPANYCRLLKALESIVEEDLATGFFPATVPPAAFVEHNDLIVKLTLLRHQKTRARRDEVDPSILEKESALGRALLRDLNGDWKKPQIQHFCRDRHCCDGFQSSVAKCRITSILAEAFFGPLGSAMPSEMRWYTFGPTLSIQAGGMFCHRIVPRVIQRAWGGDVQPIDEVADADGDGGGQGSVSSWKVHTGKKLRTSVEFMQDALAPLVIGVATLTTEAVDYLSARLQHLDHTSEAMIELIAKDSLLDECQEQLWSTLNTWSPSEHSMKLQAVVDDLSVNLVDFDFLEVRRFGVVCYYIDASHRGGVAISCMSSGRV